MITFFLGLLALCTGIWLGRRSVWYIPLHVEPRPFLEALAAPLKLFGVPWGIVWRVGVALIVIGLGYLIASFFVNVGAERVRVKLEPQIIKAQIDAGASKLEANSARSGAEDVAKRSEQESKIRTKVADASRDIIAPSAPSAPDPVDVWAAAIDGLRAQRRAQSGSEAG